MSAPDAIRLNRFLARAGLGSRRGVENLIREGRVRVDGETVSDMGRRVDPAGQRVEVDGEVVTLPDRWRVYAFHKPSGVVSSLRPQGKAPYLGPFRTRAGLPESLIPVGRLDAPTTGLLIWTDDGNLAESLMLPRRHVWKRYRVRLDRPLPRGAERELCDGGLELDGRPCLPARLEPLDGDRLDWIIQLREGRNRQVRRMFLAAGCRVAALHREAVGPVTLSDLEPGSFRELDAHEIKELRAAVTIDDAQRETATPMEDAMHATIDFEQLFRPGILKTRPYTPGKPVSEVQRELGLDDIVKLASNENPEGPPPAALEAIATAALELNRYPDGACYELTHALAAKHDVEPASIILGNGSNEVIDMIIRALVSPGESVVFSEQSFIVYPLTTGVHFESGRAVPMTADDRHDLSAMADAVDDTTKLVIVCNPNNPTGTHNTNDEFVDLLDRVPPQVMVAVDEAYYEYVVADDYPRTEELLADHPNLVICRTFSKIHSLAGLRVGYALGHPDFIGQLQKTREPFNVNSLAQAACMAILADPEETAGRARRNREWLEELEAGLIELGLKVLPSQTNFILARVPGRDAGEVQQELLRRGVIVRPMKPFGMDSESVRISVGLAEENRRCLDALKEILA